MSAHLAAWEMLRTHHHELPAQAITVFLYVASHNPCHKQAIEEDQGLTTASSSRMINLLCDGPGRKGVKTRGLGWITKWSDPINGRRQLLELTPKGKSIIRLYKQIIDGSNQNMATSRGLHLSH